MESFTVYIFTVTIIFITLFIVFFIEIKRNEEINSSIYNLLINGIINKTLNEESVNLIFKKSNEKRIGFFFLSPTYERFLESFLYSVLERENKNNGDLTKDVNEFIKPILDKLKENNPYSNVNERERRSLVSIADTIKNSANLTGSEKSAVKHYLEELAVALEENQTNLKFSKRINKWSLVISVISVILTIYFGYTSYY